MFNIQKKYIGPGCYRFLDGEARVIYIGSSKNIHRRLFSQHFKKNGTFGHLPIECYNSVYKIEIMKTKDYPEALKVEQILIDRHIPKFNKKDKRKDLFNNSYDSDIKEKWTLYYAFMEYDFNKIKMTNRQNKMAIAITILFFFSVIAYMLKGGL